MLKFNGVVASSYENSFAIEYFFKGTAYTLEVAKVDKNSHWKEGDSVAISMESF